MTEVLEKLAWAGYHRELAIKKAAAHLQQFDSIHRNPGYKELIRITKLTNPQKGWILHRREHIVAEWERQRRIQCSRESARHVDVLSPVERYQDRVQRFAKAHGLWGAAAYRRYGELLVFFLGRACVPDRIEGVAVKYPDGSVDRLNTRGVWWDSPEGALAALPTLFVDEALLSRVALEEGTVTASLINKRTTVSFPSGETHTVDWPFEQVRP